MATIVEQTCHTIKCQLQIGYPVSVTLIKNTNDIQIGDK